MSKHSFPYPEKLLQWIWNEQLFDFTNLITECGKRVTLIKPGILNKSDGPDFKEAQFLIEEIEWHGAVEIHRSADDWFSHQHHSDEKFNNVVLHVVAQKNPKQVYTTNGSTPYTLNLLPYLHPGVHRFLELRDIKSSLPCSQNIHYLSEEILEAQIDKAHHEYFEQKVNDFLSFLSPEKIQSQAWKEALIISLFDGFGISGNRKEMQEVARYLFGLSFTSPEGLISKAYEFAFTNSGIQWNRKGLRPGSQPENRIKTACRFLYLIREVPFEDFLNPLSISYWKEWTHLSGVHNSDLAKILYATVYLPALYTLGSLYFSHPLINAVKEEWKNFKAPIPKSLLSGYQQLNVSEGVYKNKLGSIHHLRGYCNQGKCHKCLVLKKAISS